MSINGKIRKQDYIRSKYMYIPFTKLSIQELSGTAGKYGPCPAGTVLARQVRSLPPVLAPFKIHDAILDGKQRSLPGKHCTCLDFALSAALF